MSDGVGQGMRMDFDNASSRKKSGKRVLPKFNSRMKGILFFEDDLDREIEKQYRENSVVMAVPGRREQSKPTDYHTENAPDQLNRPQQLNYDHLGSHNYDLPPESSPDGHYKYHDLREQGDVSHLREIS